MQDPIINDPLSPLRNARLMSVHPDTAPKPHPTARMGYDHVAHNKRVAAAAFDRARMAKCWAPRTRKPNRRADKAEASAQRYLLRFMKQNNLRIEMPVTASKEYNEANAVAVPV